MKNKYDLIVVGGGVLGSFHAYHALKKGLSVCLLEKNSRPMGASTQNFGQVVPSGMDAKWQAIGRESLKIYKEIQGEFDISARNEGSVYLASNKEELQLLEELRAINIANDYTSEMLTKEECLSKYPGTREDYVLGGLFFPEEIIIEPRRMVYMVQQYMVANLGLHLQYNTKVLDCSEKGTAVSVTTSIGDELTAAKVVICNGNEFKDLFPDTFWKSDLEVSKLQMMQTVPQPSSYRLSGSVLTGWTIRRYEAFTECPSFKTIKSKEDPESKQKKWGVHILFKQALDGSVILGDSHEYADAKKIDDLDYGLNMEIDDFMVEESKKIIDLPTYRLQRRWYGMYSQCKNRDIFEEDIEENIHIVTGIGGKGMTGSPGFSKQKIAYLFGE